MSMKSISAAVLAIALTVPCFALASETSARVYGKQQALSQQNVKLGRSSTFKTCESKPRATV